MGCKTTEKNTQPRSKHFGIVNLEIHYSLAAGLAERLGDNVEQAVFAAVSQIGGEDKEVLIGIDGTTIRMDPIWHPSGQRTDACSAKKRERALSIHLSNDLESEITYSVDWEWF